MKRVSTLIAVFVVAASAFGAQVIFEGGTANVGARFFLETRFSRFFCANSGGNANFVLTNGDPVMNTTETINGPLPGPFAGRAMNCRACHLVEEHANVGNRTYNDLRGAAPFLTMAMAALIHRGTRWISSTRCSSIRHPCSCITMASLLARAT